MREKEGYMIFNLVYVDKETQKYHVSVNVTARPIEKKKLGINDQPARFPLIVSLFPHTMQNTWWKLQDLKKLRHSSNFYGTNFGAIQSTHCLLKI